MRIDRVKALACTPPAEHAAPLSRWSCPELAYRVVTDRVCTTVPATTLRRWLAEDAIKPFQHQSWIFIRDAKFEARAARVLDLYARPAW